MQTSDSLRRFGVADVLRAKEFDAVMNVHAVWNPTSRRDSGVLEVRAPVVCVIVCVCARACACQ
jgi:hypothetical protein